MTQGTCTCDGECLILPLIDGETLWPDWVRGIIYAIAMVYCFIGVSIIADMFMGSIEAITSRRRQVQLPNGRIATRRIWNDTVANLTLMALGSSAPEILLSVIDLFKREMAMGELGPQTIVGSASFNLFMIVGICIVVIPSTETRSVRQVQVYIITTIFMFFAYIWMVVVVSLVSPGIVDIWEGAVTLIGLPVLVFISWLSDTGRLTCCMRAQVGGHGHKRSTTVGSDDVNKLCEVLGNYDKETRDACKLAIALRPKGQPPISELTQAQVESFAKHVLKAKSPRKSRAARRVEATRALTGGKRVSYDLTSTFIEVGRVAGVTGASLQDVPIATPKGTGKPIVQFACTSQTLSAELATKQVLVKREGEGSEDTSIVVYYSVESIGANTAARESNGLPRYASGFSRPSSHPSGEGRPSIKHCAIFEMGCQELMKSLTVTVPTNDSGVMAGFVVNLVGVEVTGGNDSEKSNQVELGHITSTEVELGRTEVNGIFAFAFERVMIQGTQDKQMLEVLVQRQGGCTGTVSCSYRTERLTAVPGHDYQEVDGELIFEEGVTEKFIEIEILPKGQHENKDEFLLVLENAEGGATFPTATDGGEDAEICTVMIGSLSVSQNAVFSKFMRYVDGAVNMDALRLGNAEWREAFIAAIYCNGSPEDQAEASKSDWVFHIIALPWKLFFSLVPPTAYFHGWFCFWVSLIFIGLCTGLIGDLAELFGCVLHVDDTITAIIFVALGTSMPDLFASRSAATQDPFADASIVNVTGSNSVNVFLGLGLPWTIGAIYWRLNGPTDAWRTENADLVAELGPNQARFSVSPSGIVFSVTFFCVAAILAIFLLSVRRSVVGAELGGPWQLKFVSFLTFVVLWFADVGTVSWYQVRGDTASDTEKVAVFATVLGIIALLVVGFLVIACQTARGAHYHSEDEADATKKCATSTFGQQSEGQQTGGQGSDAAPDQEISILQDGGVRCSV